MIKRSLVLMFICLGLCSCLTTSPTADTDTADLMQVEQEADQQNPPSQQNTETTVETAEELTVEPPPPPPLPNLSLTAGKTPAEIRVDQTFKSDFSVTVMDADANVPVEGAEVTVTYPEAKADGKIIFATQELTSNTEGIATFTAPKATFACKSQVTFSIESRSGTQRVEIPYQVRTNRHNKGGTISILDYTLAGNPIRDNSRSASALLTVLIRYGFSGIGLADFVNEINSGSTEAVYRAARNLIGNSSNFFVFGTVKYNGDIVQEGGKYSIPLKAEITCLNMGDGKVLHTDVIEVVGTGTSEWAALENARKDLFGPAAATSIIYGM